MVGGMPAVWPVVDAVWPVVDDELACPVAAATGVAVGTRVAVATRAAAAPLTGALVPTTGTSVLREGPGTQSAA